MSNTYLDRFRSVLPTTQGNQILKLLTKKKDSGEIKNVNEFKDKLKELTNELLAKRITPTLKLFEAIAGADTSSEQYNEMLDRIQDDLEAAFAEADNIDEIVLAHHNLINNVALKALRYGINELESKITLYEFLNKSGQGFDDALFNTFRESLNHITSRADSAASLVYIDPKNLSAIDSDKDCEVDFIGERLMLGPSNKQYLSAREAIWLSNANSIRSELNVSIRDSRISNIIDGQDNTYWVEPILLSKVRTTGVPMEVCLNLNASQDINFVEIEPASNFPMVFLGVDYYDANNTRQSAGANEVLLTGPTRINFERITTRCVIVRLRQNNYKEVQFTKKPGTSNFHKAVLGESSNAVDIDSITEDLQDLLSSDFILTDVMGLKTSNNVSVKYYEYLLGFDNLRAGFNTFQEKGIYVSEVKRVDNPGEMALRVDEARPMQEGGSSSISISSFTYPARDSTEDNKFYHGAIEYWALVEFFAEDDFLISSSFIPILPLGAERVYHEQLVFRAQSSDAVNPNVAQLMFFTEADETDVLVYRNDDLLEYGTSGDANWEFVAAGETDPANQTIVSSNQGFPMKRAIKIRDTVSSLDIYTVSYTPSLSNTRVVPSSTMNLSKVIDLVGDNSARLVDNNTIVFGETRLAQTISYINIYLMTIMRRNSAIENFSPLLEEYMLVTGTKNSSKFTG